MTTQFPLLLAELLEIERREEVIDEKPRPPSLVGLAEDSGTSLRALSILLGLDERFLGLVDAGRQPLPQVLVPPLASLLGVTQGVVVRGARRVVAGGSLLSLRAVPVDPVVGDQVPSLAMRPMAAG